MEYLSFVIDENLRDEIVNFYRDYKQENNGAYIYFFAKYEDTVITIFQSKKGYKVVFGGDNPAYEASIFKLEKNDAKVSNGKKEDIQYLDLGKQIGSDEVGWGDFFGPLIVVAAYYNEDLQDIISSIKDSKKLSDTFILKFVPTILDRVVFSKLTVFNDKLNDLTSQGMNMNEIKAKLHNQALKLLQMKINIPCNIYIDQFAKEDTYYRYLENEKEVVRNIVFRTKGESYYPSVALASMISRYCFLKEMDVMSKKYGVEFPKGANANVDAFLDEFMLNHTKEDLYHVAKLNFITYKRKNFDED